MAKNNKETQRKADAKRAGQRTRNWTTIFYPEDLPEDWQARVDKLLVRWVESPLHDKDVYTAEDEADNPEHKANTAKKKHVHALFLFDSVKNQEQVVALLKSVFGESENGSIPGVLMPQICGDRCALVRYMAHLDHPNKARYDVKAIVGHNGADPMEILKFSATETREMIIAMEEYIEDHGIVELADFSRAIRYDRPEWHTLLATKMTTYFNGFIRSCRHKAERGRQLQEESTEPPANVDPETGEVTEG